MLVKIYGDEKEVRTIKSSTLKTAQEFIRMHMARVRGHHDYEIWDGSVLLSDCIRNKRTGTYKTTNYVSVWAQ